MLILLIKDGVWDRHILTNQDILDIMATKDLANLKPIPALVIL
jgi:hypothetical protein